MRPSYLYKGNPYTGERTVLYWGCRLGTQRWNLLVVILKWVSVFCLKILECSFVVPLIPTRFSHYYVTLYLNISHIYTLLLVSILQSGWNLHITISWENKAYSWTKKFVYWLKFHRSIFLLPWLKVTQRTHDVKTTPSWRRNDVATSFRRNNDVILLHVYAGNSRLFQAVACCSQATNHWLIQCSPGTSTPNNLTRTSDFGNLLAQIESKVFYGTTMLAWYMGHTFNNWKFQETNNKYDIEDINKYHISIN